jgi:hypothetical protein
MGEIETRPNWLAKFLGLQCCGPWTSWERKERDCQVYPGVFPRLIGPDLESVNVTQVWQERRCTVCGKIQQKRLDY